MSKKNVTAVILAGGLGTRLQSVLSNKPKVLATVKGRPFLSYILDQLYDADFKRVVLCTGYKADHIQKAFGDVYKSLVLVYSQEVVPLDTGGALRLAYPLLESERVLVMNGDSYCQVDLEAFEKWHCERKVSVSMVLTQVPDVSRFGRIRISTEKRVLTFEEKTQKAVPGLINVGIYMFSRLCLLEIPEKEKISLEKTMFPKWVSMGIFGFETRGKFIDIGTPESFASAEEFFGNCAFEL